MGSKTIFLVLAVSWGATVLAQSAASPGVAASVDPSVTFTLDFPGSVPSYYSITVAASGKASYTSGRIGVSATDKGNAGAKTSSGIDSDSTSDSDSESVSDSSPETPYQYQFKVGEPNRTRIFDLAARAHYFQSELNYNKHNLANTGAKTLAYQDGRVNNHATYNYTTNQPAQQLTALFQNMSATLEFGRQLSDSYRHQKLALEQELKRMEEMAKASNLEELQAVSPILKQILADKTVINVTRARAERLLALAAAGR